MASHFTESKEGKRVLVFRSANVHQTGRALQRIKGRFPDAELTLLLPAHHMEYFRENPLIDTLCIYDTAKDGAWRTATTLIKELRRKRFDLLVILSPSPPRVAHLYSVILFSLFIPAEQRILIDGEDHETDVFLTHKLWAVIDSAIFFFWDCVRQARNRDPPGALPEIQTRDSLRRTAQEKESSEDARAHRRAHSGPPGYLSHLCVS